MKESISSLSIQETFKSMDLIILLATGHHRQLMKAMDTLKFTLAQTYTYNFRAIKDHLNPIQGQ